MDNRYHHMHYAVIEAPNLIWIWHKCSQANQEREREREYSSMPDKLDYIIKCKCIIF